MKLLVCCLWLVPLLGFGQLPQRIDSVAYPGGNSLALIMASPEGDGRAAAQLADHDIANGHLFLLLQSGISPIIYVTDKDFCQKFALTYWEEGCTGSSLVNAKAYNQRVFAFLTTAYGQRWLMEVRKDVIGLQEWKRIRRL